MKKEKNPAEIPSKKIAGFIVADTIKVEGGNRAVISELADNMRGVEGFAVTQEMVKDMFGAGGTIDARVLNMKPREVNVQTILVQAEIVRRLQYFSRPIVGESVDFEK